MISPALAVRFLDSAADELGRKSYVIIYDRNVQDALYPLTVTLESCLNRAGLLLSDITLTSIDISQKPDPAKPLPVNPDFVIVGPGVAPERATALFPGVVRINVHEPQDAHKAKPALVQ